jgi:hypothetical protein
MASDLRFLSVLLQIPARGLSPGTDSEEMALPLTDTFVRPVKHKGARIGERYADGGGMYLRVRAEG